MLTKITIRNLKCFEEVEVDLGSPVAFIGPNNSGKTSAMQALTLWDVGVKSWKEKRAGKGAPEKRPGVTISREELIAIPLPSALMLWNGLKVRKTEKNADKWQVENVRIDIVVEGITKGVEWSCGLEFDYANEASFYCRPLRIHRDKKIERMPVPIEAGEAPVTFLSPMSGLAAVEPRLELGAINVRIGEGRTAEVLRNLCHKAHTDRPDDWARLIERADRLFGIKLATPRYIPRRGEIKMGYREGKTDLDISCSGRGFQQTLLILAFMCNNPGSVILMDEPDAHLEILRQRRIYGLVSEEASRLDNQIIMASHSEVVLNEAATAGDTVVAFVGKPHRMLRKKAGVVKSLVEIDHEDYLQAEQTGWVLYLEGPSDLQVLRAFARRLGHADAEDALELPFVNYVSHHLKDAKSHFSGLAEALPDLRGIALLDRPPKKAPEDGLFPCLYWKKREIESYLCSQGTLEAFAKASAADSPLLAQEKLGNMRRLIAETERAMADLAKGSPWDGDSKVSDDFLVPLFLKYSKEEALLMRIGKQDFHILVEHIPDQDIDPEVREKLDAIAKIAHPGS